MITRETAYQKIAGLIERFEEQYDSYKKADYNETLTRRDFIDPFFKALGWDVDNEQGYAEAYREVIHEDRVKIGHATKAPDYSFRLPGGKRLFFVEAKKPSVVVKDDIYPAYQVRRYGWSAKLPVSIITDFEEFAVYDCIKKPNPTDKASVARIKYLTFRDYLNEFDFLWDTFSKEKVLKGSFDKFVQGTTNKKGTATVDREFLESLDKWRTYLATSISLQNKLLDEDEINFAVQQTIDRIIFLRIAEDRSIEPYGNLRTAVKQGDLYQNLITLFREADQKYNSGLFDFGKDRITEGLKVDNKVIRTIVNELYYPESPYEFSVLSVEILGSAYEQFLGKTISIDKSHHARIEEKPEVRKAGGVYYTPQYIVEYIVQNTVGKLIEGKSPEEVSKLRFVDPACGSGSFLIGAYQYLLEWHKNYYTANPSKNRKNPPLTPDGLLSTAEKKRILLNNIYGVDIDVNAVEVTKLSLLLKCMEGETQASISQQLSMFNERVLPTLDNNIKSGNSLIDLDFYDTQLDFGEEKKVRPFSWQKAFPEVFANGGFDAVIGNPPYGVILDEILKNYFISKFNAVEGRFDNFELFLEKGLSNSKRLGLLGFIIPSPFLTNLYSKKLRSWILDRYSIIEIINFSMPVFEDPTVHTCIVIIKSVKDEEPNMIKIKNEIDTIEHLTSIKGFCLPQENFKTNPNFVFDIFIDETAKNVIDKIQMQFQNIGHYCFIRQCIKTGDDRKFVMKNSDQLSNPWKPSLRGKSIGRYSTIEKDLYLKYGDWLARNWKNRSFYETKKIAIRETGKRITATIDFENRYFLSSLYAVYFKKNDYNTDENLKCLLGILNSTLTQYYIKLIAFKLTEGAFTKIRTNQLARLPIPQFFELDFTSKIKVDIIKYVDQLLDFNVELHSSTLSTRRDQIQSKIDYCEDRINRLVYELYGLTEEEIAIVEGSAGVG